GRIAITLDVLALLLRGTDKGPDVVLLATLAGRLPRLEKLGYAWVRFRRLGFGNVCSGSKVLEFEGALDSARELAAPITTDVNQPAYILPTGGTTGAPKAVTLAHRNLMAN